MSRTIHYRLVVTSSEGSGRGRNPEWCVTSSYGARVSINITCCGLIKIVVSENRFTAGFTFLRP